MDALPRMRSDWSLKMGLLRHEDGQGVQFARARIASNESGGDVHCRRWSLSWATPQRGAHESIGTKREVFFRPSEPYRGSENLVDSEDALRTGLSACARQQKVRFWTHVGSSMRARLVAGIGRERNGGFGQRLQAPSGSITSSDRCRFFNTTSPPLRSPSRRLITQTPSSGRRRKKKGEQGCEGQCTRQAIESKHK
jgi:hypothetical protein